MTHGQLSLMVPVWGTRPKPEPPKKKAVVIHRPAEPAAPMLLDSTSIEGKPLGEWATLVEALEDKAVRTARAKGCLPLIDMTRFPPAVVAALRRWRAAGAPTEVSVEIDAMNDLKDRAFRLRCDADRLELEARAAGVLKAECGRKREQAKEKRAKAEGIDAEVRQRLDALKERRNAA